jgi:hypothetical protein
VLNGKCSRDVWIHGHRNTPSFDGPGSGRGIVRDTEQCLLFMISRRPMAESHRAVRANWRTVFRFENGRACDVDLVDYH